MRPFLAAEWWLRTGESYALKNHVLSGAGFSKSAWLKIFALEKSL